MYGYLGGLLNKTFIVLLVVLGVVGLALSAIFNFVAVSQLNVEMGLLLFVLATILLILGYMLGIIALGFLSVSVLTRLWQRKRENPASTAK